MELKTYPESFYNNGGLRLSNFAIAGRNILEKYKDFLSNDKPIILKLKSKLGINFHVSILEFSAPDNVLYVNDNAFDQLCINTGDVVQGELFDPPDATKVIFKPLNDSFYKIEDVKSILENSIIKKYQFLTKGQIISINYFDSIIKLEVSLLEPYDICRTTEIDLNVDFLPIDEIQNKSSNLDENQESVLDDSNISQNLDNFVNSAKSNEYGKQTGRVNTDDLNLTSNLSIEELRKRRLNFFTKKFTK